MTKPAAAARVAWVDTGRGLAITLVVLFHATNWLSGAGFPVEGWLSFNAVASAIRMPVFFVMSGLFAGKWLTAPWWRLWSVKLSLFVWVYGLWSVIATFTFMAGLHLQGNQGNYLSQFKATAQLLWSPRFELWFIWALALMFFLVRVMRAVPVAVQLLLAGIASFIVLSGFISVNSGVDGLLKYFFFFLLGLHGRRFFLWWAARVSFWQGFLVIIGGAGLAVVGALLGWSTQLPGYYFVTCCAGALAGVIISRELSRIPLLAVIGKRTLPIYLTHTSIVILICWTLAQLPDSAKGLPLGVVLPPVLVVAAIAASLWLGRLVKDWRILRYLYEQPAWFANHPRPVPEAAGPVAEAEPVPTRDAPDVPRQIRE